MKRKNWRARKSSKSKSKPATPQVQRPLPRIAPPRKTWTIAKKVFAVVISAIGLGASLLGFYLMRPKPSITPTGTLQADNPRFAQFQIANDGEMDMHEVKVEVGILRLDDKQHIRIEGISFNPAAWNFPLITAGEGATFTLSELIGRGNLTAVEVVFTVSYRPSFLWWRVDKRQRYVTVKDNKGEFLWNIKPVTSQR